MVQTDTLAGKRALVTGGTGTIGRAIVEAMAGEGARVAFAGRDAERGAEVAAATGAAFVRADLDGTPAASAALADQAKTALRGPIDILVNNAGIFPGTATAQTDEATFDAIFSVNVKAPFFLTAAIAPEMAARGAGVIINLGSWVARLGISASPAYAASKGALETLTRAWAAEFGPAGVRVNAISPGVIRADDLAERAGAMMRGTPSGRPGGPEAIAHAAVYLAEAAFVHGAVIDVDGGRTGVAVIQG